MLKLLVKLLDFREYGYSYTPNNVHSITEFQSSGALVFSLRVCNTDFTILLCRSANYKEDLCYRMSFLDLGLKFNFILTQCTVGSFNCDEEKYHTALVIHYAYLFSITIPFYK